ncbi:MAG: hypothetical protein HC884_14845 [Chloroflexaceae bacterium]|nr:hypothetical protein [Chloroflexaceae bacterium]
MEQGAFLLTPRVTTTLLPAGVVAGSVVVRSAISGNPSWRSKMTSYPVSNPRPATVVVGRGGGKSPLRSLVRFTRTIGGIGAVVCVNWPADT